MIFSSIKHLRSSESKVDTNSLRIQELYTDSGALIPLPVISSTGDEDDLRYGTHYRRNVTTPLLLKTNVYSKQEQLLQHFEEEPPCTTIRRIFRLLPWNNRSASFPAGLCSVLDSRIIITIKLLSYSDRAATCRDISIIYIEVQSSEFHYKYKKKMLHSKMYYTPARTSIRLNINYYRLPSETLREKSSRFLMGAAGSLLPHSVSKLLAKCRG